MTQIVYDDDGVMMSPPYITCAEGIKMWSLVGKQLISTACFLEFSCWWGIVYFAGCVKKLVPVAFYSYNNFF